MSKMTLEEALTLARAFSHYLNLMGIAKTHHSQLVQGGVSLEKLYDIVCNQGVEIVLTAHFTQINRRTLQYKHIRIAHTGRPLPLTCTPIKFGAWMGGDRDENPNVTAKLIVVMASHCYMVGPFGELFVEYLMRHCAISDKDRNNLESSKEAVRPASTYYVLPYRRYEHVLLPFLLKMIMPPIYTGAVATVLWNVNPLDCFAWPSAKNINLFWQDEIPKMKACVSDTEDLKQDPSYQETWDDMIIHGEKMGGYGKERSIVSQDVNERLKIFTVFLGKKAVEATKKSCWGYVAAILLIWASTMEAMWSANNGELMLNSDGHTSEAFNSNFMTLVVRKVLEDYPQLDLVIECDKTVETEIEMVFSCVDGEYAPLKWITTFGCSLAKHRKSNTLEANDILLHLDTVLFTFELVKRSIAFGDIANTRSSVGKAFGNAKSHIPKA
ncbi:hypothetical protein RHMOL_Rhmol05G0116400 [Rhododendron molle]|uniref:Uncharacterized protein n=1 Tax=Rhododendron molle TaxID=49168 RepID=A0ACC0NPI8_RHOML|nr:hypothetical protein RHMOL_Rhmol05G0116400 [Rhododendron molle]